MGNPPTFDFETALRTLAFAFASSGAGPPCGHPTSDGCTLDGAPAGFGPVDHLFSQGLSRPAPARLSPCGRRSIRALSSRGASADSDPLTPLVSDRIGIRASPRAPVPFAGPCFHRPTSMSRLPPSRGAFRRARPASKLFRAPPRCAVLAGRPGQLPHVFIEVRGPRLDPCSYALRVRLQGRVRSHDFCNRCFREHDHGPLRTSRAAGNRRRDDCPVRRKSPFGLAAAGASRGQGPRLTLPRYSPPRLLPAETLPRPRSLRAPPVARTVPLPVRSDVGDERNRRRSAHLHGTRCERVVRRPTSAKRRDVHQPEGPSIDRLSATRTGLQ